MDAVTISDEERAAFKQSELERIADLHPGVDKLLIAERRATVQRIRAAMPEERHGNDEDHGFTAALHEVLAILEDEEQ